MLKNLKHFCRIIYIGFVFLKNRKNIALSLEELGPAYIKLGQFLSTRPDLVGEELASSLDYLRDKLPAFSFTKVKEIIKQEFRKEIDELYSSFSEAPVAAASIAQVHKAKTIEGGEVAVKVQRPNIEKILLNEIEFFYFMSKIINKLFPKYKRLKLKDVVRTIETSFKFEIDLSFEAAAASELSEKNKLEFIRIPKIDWLRTGNKILTMEWMEAVSIYEKEKLQNMNIDLKKLATNFAIMFFYQSFVNGFFHADFYQGNIMIDKDGNIILLDFGIMGRLDQDNRNFIAQILNGFLNKDYALIANLHHEAGYIDSKVSIDVFAQSLRAIGEPIMNLAPSQICISSLLARLFKVTEDFQMETQPQLLLLQKTMIMVEGIAKIICLEQNLWILAEPWIKTWAKENLSIEAKAAKLIKKIIKDIIKI